MKRIILLLFILISLKSFGQITNASYTNKGATVPFLNSSSYKLDGTTLDSANTVKRGFFTKYQYNYLHSIIGSQWTTSGLNIYYNTGKVIIGASTTPLSNFFAKGTSSFDLKYDELNSFRLFNDDNSIEYLSINTGSTGENIVFDAAIKGIKIGIAKNPSYKLDVTGEIRSSSYIMQQGIYAGIYVADASTAQSIANGTTYTKSTAFTTNGNAANCTSDATNDKITITKTGKYLVNGTCSFSSGTSNVVWKGCAFLDGVEQSNIHWARKVGSSGDVGSASFMGTINVTSVPVDLDMRFRHDQGSATNITVQYANFTVIYIGE